MLDSDAESARTLTLVTIILQLAFFLVFAFIFVIIGTLAFASAPAGMGTFNVMSIILFIMSIFAIIGIVWVLLDYFLVYKPLSEGHVQSAETPALVLSILQILFGGIITGILLLIAWVKIKDSLRFQEKRKSSASM